ncbi:signal peptidase I [Evansella sp. AB-P1]|nr:signal peptidase I [Evansella sp. AB-P1]MDG5788784.1 signal peptidase I [Evansella sp. AB-P1]
MVAEQVPERDTRKKVKWKKRVWKWSKILTLVVILVIVFRAFLFTNYIVHGKSMMPTIHDGERIIVNKIGYEIAEPKRFDLIIFHATETSDYIKRVIGVPGDHIEYKDDILYVNGKSIEESFINHYRDDYEDGTFTDDFSLESVTDSNYVPEGHVFVLGDNRQNSVDSRHIGFVEYEKIVGRVNFTYWPPNNLRIFE